MKIVALIPCLMQDNNRKYNLQCMATNLKTIPADKFVVCAQCFTESDYLQGIEYIGNFDTAVGWSKTRNTLLNWFYNSDCDYAFWIDANSVVSKSSLNDLCTVFNYIKTTTDVLPDTIFSTLGMVISAHRVEVKKQSDYMDCVKLLPLGTSRRDYTWFHGLFMKNYKKYYNIEYFVDNRCNPKDGVYEDVYFSRVLRLYTNCYLAPTITINKPFLNQTSTWLKSDNDRYAYPPIKHSVTDLYIIENIDSKLIRPLPTRINEPVTIPRIDYMKNELRPYKPKRRENNINTLVRSQLF